MKDIKQALMRKTGLQTIYRSLKDSVITETRHTGEEVTLWRPYAQRSANRRQGKVKYRKMTLNGYQSLKATAKLVYCTCKSFVKLTHRVPEKCPA